MWVGALEEKGGKESSPEASVSTIYRHNAKYDICALHEVYLPKSGPMHVVFIFQILKQPASFKTCHMTRTHCARVPSKLTADGNCPCVRGCCPYQMSSHIISRVFPLIPPSSRFSAKEWLVVFPNMKFLLKNHAHLSPYPCNIDGLLFNKLNLIETIFLGG